MLHYMRCIIGDTNYVGQALKDIDMFYFKQPLILSRGRSM